MNDYIKRKDAIEEINKTLNMFGRDHTITDYDAIDCILAVPSADVVEVVRCKDCKYWQDNNGGYPNKNCRWMKDETPDDDDYCSYGERQVTGKLGNDDNPTHPTC